MDDNEHSPPVNVTRPRYDLANHGLVNPLLTATNVAKLLGITEGTLRGYLLRRDPDRGPVSYFPEPARPETLDIWEEADEHLTSDQMAAMLGIQPSTFRAYLARGQATERVRPADLPGQPPAWLLSQVIDYWNASAVVRPLDPRGVVDVDGKSIEGMLILFHGDSDLTDFIPTTQEAGAR